MSKLNVLEIVNKVLNNLGETEVAALTNLSGISKQVFNAVNELLYEIAFEYKYKPLEKSPFGSLTLSQGIATASLPSDMYAFDKDSFKYEFTEEIKYFTPSRLDRDYPDQTSIGGVTRISHYGNLWRFQPVPSAGNDGKIIKYRYWILPTPFGTAPTSQTCWIPEGFDLTLLCDYATWKILHYKHNTEQVTYYRKVWGDGRWNEGSYSRFKTLYGSPEIIDENIMTEPM